MFCRSCGRELPENAKFCSGCGAPVSAPAEEPKAAEPPVEEVPTVIELTAGEPVQPGETSPVQPSEPAADAAPADVPQDDLSAALDQPAAAVVAAVPEIQPVHPAPPIPPVPPTGNGAAPGEAKKRGRGLLLLGIAAIVVIVLVVAVIKLLPSGGGKSALVYLNDDNELMFRKDFKVKTESVEVGDDGAASVLFSKDGKYLYFLEGDDYSDTGTLYRIETAKIGKKDVSPEKISPDVSRYNVSVLDSGGAVYIRGSSDGQLRYYDGKESYKLASGVNYFTLNEKGTYAYYTEYDPSDYTSSLYRVEIKDGGEKERLLKNADIIYSGYTTDTLVYGASNGSDSTGTTTYDVYSQKVDGDKTKLLSDVYSVLDTTTSAAGVSILYLTAEVEEHTLYDFVSDSLASSDAGEREPSTSDYQTRNAWGWTTTDWDAYDAAWEDWSEVMMRNDVRQELKDIYYNLTTYTLHRYEDGKDTVLAEGLSSAYPLCSASDGIYIYPKSEQDVSILCDVSDLYYWSDIYERMDASERTWYQNVNGTESGLDLGEDGNVYGLYVLNGKEAIINLYEDGETSLQAYSIGKSGLTFSSTVADEDYSGIGTGRRENQDAFYYFTDLNRDYTSGDLMCYVDGSKTTVAKDTSWAVLLDDGKTVFKIEDINYSSNSNTTECSLYLVKDGKSERIADEVALYDIAFLGAKQVVYVSEGDLYSWNGSASEKLANDVTGFWTSQQADSQSWSLDW